MKKNWDSLNVKQSFEEQLKIDEFPVWWFYNRIFTRHVMPSPVNTFKDMEGKIKFSYIKRKKLDLSSKILENLLYLREQKKLNYFKGKSHHSKEKKVLFLSYSNYLDKEGKLFRIQKIVDNLPNSQIVFVDPLSSFDYKKLKGKKTIYDYYDNTIKKESKKSAQELFEKWQRYQEEPLENWQYLKYGFRLFFSKKLLALLVTYYKLFEKALENTKVVVITGQSSIFEKCLIAVASKKKVPVLRLQHGVGEELVTPDIFDNVYKLVFSEKVKKDLEKLGYPSEKVKVVGPVIFDDIVNYVKPKKKERNVLIATPGTWASGILETKTYFSRLKKIINRMKEVHLIIKLHPRETKNHWQKYKEEFPNIKIFEGKISRKEFYDLIQWSDVFITFGSTASIEAMIVKRPVVNINLLDDKFVTGWIEEKKITINCQYYEDVGRFVEQAFSDYNSYFKKQENFLKEKCGKLDGKAYQRVVDIVKSLPST